MPQPLDPVYLTDIFEAGGAPLVREIVDTFLADVPRRLGSLEDGLAAGDWNAAALAAHALVSGSSMLGLTAVAGAARRIEHVLSERRRPAAADLEALDTAIGQARALLAAAVAGLTGQERSP